MSINRKHCGGVMYIKVDYPEKPCVKCGEIFKPKSKLSTLCPTHAKNRSVGRLGRTKEQQHKESIDSRKRACIGCGKEYIKKKHNKSVDGNSYCSRECSNADSKNQNRKRKYWGEYSEVPKYTLIKQFNCVECGALRFKRAYENKKYCPECRHLSWKHGATKRLNHRECRYCGILFTPLTGFGLGSNCSDECKEKADLKAYRANKALRRARERQAMKQSNEQFDPIDVLERDGWVCQACGCDTPKALRGTIDDNAPQLDHITPLAKGGEHTTANTQCLCRVCNILKSDKTMIEFMNECSESTSVCVSLFKRAGCVKPMYIQHTSINIPTASWK